MDNVLDQIIAFADQAHGDQMRKYEPNRYIVHPIRVMNTCKRVTDDPGILAAAILHDVLEDTPVTKDELLQYLESVLPSPVAKRTLELVTDLTDVYVKKKYPKLNRRTRKAKELARLEKTSPDAQTIKYADIIDNAAEIAKYDPGFAPVFLCEYQQMLKKLDKGNTLLYDEAVKLVNNAIAQLPKA